MVLVKQIIQYYAQNSLPCSTEEDIDWVFKHWPEFMLITVRLLSDDDLKSIKQAIARISTGKRRSYRGALEDITQYLAEACLWTMPESLLKQSGDRDLMWFDRLNQQAECADQLYQAFNQDKTVFLTKRPPVSPAFAAITIAIQVAPVSLYYLADILNSSASIIRMKTETYLHVDHRHANKGNDDSPYFTRYRLDIFSYRLLSDYYSQNPPSVTPNSLLQLLNCYLLGDPYYLDKMTNTQFHLILQSLWHYQYQLPPTLLKDFSQPERHVAIDFMLGSMRENSGAIEKLYTVDWDQRWFENCQFNSTKKTQWPHHLLLGRIKKGKNKQQLLTKMGKQSESIWQPDNILPELMYIYCTELIVHGGMKKPILASRTIRTYTNIYLLFTDCPLSYTDAIDAQQLQDWAVKIYEMQESDSHKKVLYYFFRFMQNHPLTEQLDLSDFIEPSIQPTVDAFRLSIDTLDIVLANLISAPDGSYFQRLCCFVATCLAYHGALRRGEILRLRQKDIFFSINDPQYFQLEVTHTREGKTKSGKSRTVHIVLPEEQAKLVRTLIEMKQGSDANLPLIGFADEKMSSRNLSYLLPITRALKAICGQHARFHHLRHSGVHLLYLQMMHLCYGKPPSLKHFTPAEARLLSQRVIKRRFYYWLEGRDILLMNRALAFDEITREIGHSNYATTRWSYLHGLEWLAPIVLPEKTEYTHAEISYYLGLAYQSNDLSRQLLRLVPERSQLTISERQADPILLQDSAIRSLLWQKQKVKAESQEHTMQTHQQQLQPIESHTQALHTYYEQWQAGIGDTLLDKLILASEKMADMDNAEDKSLLWQTLSLFWKLSGMHYRKYLSKPQKLALNKLCEQCLEEDSPRMNEMDCFAFTLSCNVNNGRLYRLLFSESELTLFIRSFTLHINRKTNPERQLNILHEHFILKKEPITVVRHATGQTQLIVHLALPPDFSARWARVVKENVLTLRN